MKFVKGQWIKYSNKIFPRYIIAHWEIAYEKDKFKIFTNWEVANIYEELLKLKRELRNSKRLRKKGDKE